jgi:hypothetical protein
MRARMAGSAVRTMAAMLLSVTSVAGLRQATFAPAGAARAGSSLSVSAPRAAASP